MQQQQQQNLVVIVPLGPAAQSVGEGLRHIIFGHDGWETKYYRAPIEVVVESQCRCDADITLFVHVGDYCFPINGESPNSGVQVLLNFTDIPILSTSSSTPNDLEEIVFGCRALIDLNENWRHASETHPALLTQEGGFREDPFRRLKTIIDTASWSYSMPLNIGKGRKGSYEVAEGGDSSDHATATSVLAQEEDDDSHTQLHS